MSQEPSQSGGAKWVLFAWVVVPALLLVTVIVAILLQAPKPPPLPPDGGGGRLGEANDLAVVRTMLAKQNDLATCKTAVNRLNAHLRQPGANTVPEMPAADRDRLKSELGLSDAEAAEAASTSFTPLDAHHLETCFLLRDAAISLETAAPAGKGKVARMTPLERAEVGFAWVCRQIRLQKPELDPAPVAFGLRRGWGTPGDRALAFLALIEQFGLQEDDAAGLQGCLLLVPGKGGARLWACGVAVGVKPDALYLFDPRIGLPLPGPGGKGIATLAQAQTDPSVLSQLDSGAIKYDVTVNDAKAADLQLVSPLSSTTPRMLVLQNVLLRERSWKDRPLPPAIRIRLAETPAVARATIQSAAKGQALKFAHGLATLLAQSLPKEEGGTDTGVRVDLSALPGFAEARDRIVVTIPRPQLIHLTAVPWLYFPARFRNIDEFGLNAGIGRDLRQVFQVPFLKAMSDPSAPREAILRGRIAQSTSEALVREREMWLRSLQLPDPNREDIQKWIDEINPVHAAVLRGGPGEMAAKTALANLYRWKPGEAMEVLMAKSIGQPRAMDLTYQLGLCMHERGERSAARVALAARNGQSLPDEKKRSDEAYQAAAGWWRELAAMGGATQPAARRFLGEALWALGQKDKAREEWKDMPVALSEVEKVAAPWLGR